MTQGLAYRNEGPFTLVSGEALAEARFVLLSSGTAKYADAGEEPVGITGQAVESGKPVTTYPLKGNIERVTGSKAITLGSAIYVAADGKVTDAAVGKQIGVLMTTISADGGKGSAIIWGPRGGNDIFSNTNSIVHFRDDFFQYDPTATVGKYVVTEDAGASAPDALDATLPGGVLHVGSDGDDHDECYVASVSPLFKFQTDKKVLFEARVRLTEAHTDDANFIAGLCSVYAADTLINDGGGPVATYDGAVFFKVDGTMKIQFETSNASTQETNSLLADFVSATWYTLGFLYDPNDGVTAKVTPFVDGAAGTTHDLTIAGLDALLYVLFGVKTGGDTYEEGLKVDYVDVKMER